MTRRLVVGTAIILLLTGPGALHFDHVHAQSKPAASRELPPVSWTCPMHPEVVTNKGGKCPICQMNLVQVRLDLVWSCTLHTEVAKHEAGKCPKCQRDLVRVIKSLSWGCPRHPKVDELAPGRCPIDKRTLVARYSDRPHGDHNPKHGGFFFMAPNNWHVEATHPAKGVFRMHVYDEYSKPFLPPGFSARMRVKGVEKDVPFTRVGRRDFLEAKVPNLGVPAVIVVHVKFSADGEEYRFDFQFYEFSKEPAPSPTA